MSKAIRMAQLRRAVQLWLDTIADEALLQEVATVAPAWAAGRSYRGGEVLTEGVNALGDPQLWRVLQAHTSAQEWPPAQSPSLYKAVGLEGGLPVWAQPLMAEDAYGAGDIVIHRGTRWESLVDSNVWEPGVYGWKEA